VRLAVSCYCCIVIDIVRTGIVSVIAFPELRRLRLIVTESMFGDQALIALSKANPCLVDVEINRRFPIFKAQPERSISCNGLIDFVLGATRLRRLKLFNFSKTVVSRVINSAAKERHPSLRYVNDEILLYKEKKIGRDGRY
jgi:hypothetical protein